MLKRESRVTIKDQPLASSTRISKEEIISPCLIQCPVVHCDRELYTFQDRILHQKCPIVKLVRHQMSEATIQLNDDIESLKSRKTWLERIKRWKYHILALLFLLILIWLVFLYGTLLGAYICSGKSLKLCKMCTFVLSITPGIQYMQNSKNVF